MYEWKTKTTIKTYNPHAHMFEVIAERLQKNWNEDAAIALSYLGASWGINSEIIVNVIAIANANSRQVMINFTISVCSLDVVKTIRNAIHNICGPDSMGLKKVKEIIEGHKKLTINRTQWERLKPQIDALDIVYAVSK